MKTRTVLAAALTSIVLVSAGCATQPPPAPTEVSSVEQSRLAAKYGLEGKTPEQIIETLDRDPRPRPLPLVASVRSDHVILSDGTDQETLKLTTDKFYLSVAPYAARTHECHFHNLGTCQGELASKPVKITITDSDGKVLVDEQTSTYANGFVAFWIPRDITGTVRVETDGKSGETQFDSKSDGATCVTTLQVS